MKERKYRVRITNTLSQNHIPLVGMDLKAHCCISLSNPNYTGKRLRALLIFLKEHFSSTQLVLGGYLYRHNMAILGHRNELQAIDAAMGEQKKYIDTHLNACEDILKDSNITIKEWQHLYHADGFQKSADAVADFYRSDVSFKEKIMTTASEFLNYSKYLHPDPNIHHDLNKPRNLTHCVAFLLEESAMFDYLVRSGYPVSAYPGKITTALNDIIIGGHLSAPEGLKKRINVELSIQHYGKKRNLKNKSYDLPAYTHILTSNSEQPVKQLSES